MKRLIQLVVLLCTGIVVISFFRKTSGEKYFAELLMARDEVTGLEAFGRDETAYDMQLRFKATAEWVDRLTYEGFQESECSAADSQLEFSLFKIAAWPLWQPSSLVDVTCFIRRGPNALSDKGRALIIAESDGGWVYAHFRGRKRDRNLPDEFR